jgi:hypothetical protein
MPRQRGIFIFFLCDWIFFLSSLYGKLLGWIYLPGNMDKLDSKLTTQFFGIPPGSHSDRGPARRLIVLFPASEIDTPNLSHRIWEIAQSFQLNVLLLGLFNHFEEEAQLRRKMITMAAMIKDPNISAEIMIENGNDWVKQVRKVCETGDIVACYTGHRVGLMRKPLDQILRSSLDIPVYILAGTQTIKNSRPTFLSQLYSWSGSLALIGGFFWVEVKLVQLPQDWRHTALIYVCIFMEIPLILMWNSLFS